MFDWEDFYIYEVPDLHPDLQDTLEKRRRLELLHPFTSEESIPIRGTCANYLQELVGGMTEVLPILQKNFLEGLQQSGPVHEAIGQFIAAQQLTSYPIAVTHWEKKKKVVEDDD